MANNTTPREKASARKVSIGCALWTSGAWYAGFPRTSAVVDRLCVDIPKSMILILCSPLSLWISRFSRDRSRWATPRSCSQPTPAKICLARGCIAASLSGPSSGADSHQANRSPSDANELTTYMSWPSAKILSSLTQNAKPTSLRCLTVPTSTHGLSDDSGYRASKSLDDLRIQSVGILFTATCLPPVLMSSTQPKFRSAACSCLTTVNRPSSHGWMPAAASSMLVCNRLGVSGKTTRVSVSDGV
mmetsp:Transcript_64472/g.182925  ORF Transcript_64472/g.182925 Transcript_64472/m.182925 type:complete len:245 (+) Transcript_64472:201-935(+)